EDIDVVHHVVGRAAVAAIAVAVAVSRALGPVAALITEIASHRDTPRPAAGATGSRLLSRNAESCDFDTAPTFCASTAPFLKRIRVGIPRMPNFGGVCGFSSILSFAIFSRS